MRFLIIFSLVMLSLFAVFKAYAGDEPVTEFKETVEEASKEEESSYLFHNSNENKYDDAAGGLFELFANFFMPALVTSLEEGDFGYTYRELKKNNHPALPTIRLEGMYQYAFDNTNVLNVSGEAGYLMFGIDGRYTKYWQKKPSDTLDVISGHFLIRSYLAEVFQINMALGMKYIKAISTHKGFEIGFPFYVFFGKYVFWDVKPYMAFMPNYQAYDMGSGINFKYKMFGARIGYKVMYVDTSSIHGPEFGLFFQW